nr:hypothetical protein GCM10025699_11540 [Microbacterium flavescens]
MLDPTLIQVIAVVALIIAVLGLITFIARRIRRVPPNEALVIVGRGAGKPAPGESGIGQRVVIGGRTFVWPILQQGFSISLEQRQIGITVEGSTRTASRSRSRRPSTSRCRAPKMVCAVRPSASSRSRARSPRSSRSRSKDRCARSSAT